MNIFELLANSNLEKETKAKEGYIMVDEKSDVILCSIGTDNEEDAIEFFFEKFPKTKCLYKDDHKLIVKRGNLLNEIYNVYAEIDWTVDDTFGLRFYNVRGSVKAYVNEEKLFFIEHNGK